MKKVLALVLAVMMMATVAFAVDATNPGENSVANADKFIIPGEKIKFNDSGIKDALGPGATISKGDVKSVNSTNYSISKVKWDEGRNLVESVKFNDTEDRVEIKLKQDFTLTTEKKLKGEITLKGKKVGKNPKNPDILIKIDRTVGYTLADGKVVTGTKAAPIDVNPCIQIDGTKEEASLDVGMGATTSASTFDADANEKYLWKVLKGKDAYGKDVTYGTLEFDAADPDTQVEVRVYDGDKLYLYNDVGADNDILKAYADNDAEITFLTFKGAPTFNATATVRFYKDEDSYVYGVKDGKLVNVNAKWDDDEGCFVLKTRTLGAYVFSDKKLSVSAATAGSENPDTGANDVVGIASALAAVALVSAAAVSLKK